MSDLKPGKTFVAECKGGPLAGKLKRWPSDLVTFTVPELTPIGLEYHVYRLVRTASDNRPQWKYEGVDGH